MDGLDQWGLGCGEQKGFFHAFPQLLKPLSCKDTRQPPSTSVASKTPFKLALLTLPGRNKSPKEKGDQFLAQDYWTIP